MTTSKELSPSTIPFYPNVFFNNQFRSKPQWPPQGTSLSGKVAVVTGANSGLGLECSRQLLSLGLSRLIVSVRSIAKGEAAAAKLRDQFPKATIDVWQLDMSSYGSTQAFAARCARELAHIDIAVLNAGMASIKFKVNPNTGHEETVQVNYLSTVLLALLLLPVLKKTPGTGPGRLTIVNAALTLVAKFPSHTSSPLLPSLDRADSFDFTDQYSTSKLLSHMFLWKLVDLVAADDIIVNLADPGLVKGTNLGRDTPAILIPLAKLFKTIFGRSLRVGASTSVDGCVIKGKESHGCFLMNWQIHPFAPLLYTPNGQEAIERLWTETMHELEFAKVQEALSVMNQA